MASQDRNAPRLGRGLSSLISNSIQLSEEQKNADTSVATSDNPQSTGQKTSIAVPKPTQETKPTASNGPVHIPVQDIAANPYQPRRDFKESELAELTESIKQQGVLQPLIVAEASDPNADEPYVLIAGERRLRAARKAELETIPCVIRQAGRREMIEWSIIENIQRSDLNPLERAAAYREYMDRFSLTHAQVAQRLSQPRTTVSNYLRILDLSSDVQEMIRREMLSFGHAKVLAGLTGNPEQQIKVAKKIVSEGMSVRELEKLVKRLAGQQGDEQQDDTKAKDNKSAYLRDLEEQLTRTVGTRVQIKPGRSKHSGKIAIEYYNLDDFDRIASALGLRLES